MSVSSPVLIDVWSDYACPMCCLQMPVIDRLRREDAAIEWHWRAFERRPEPLPLPDPVGPAAQAHWTQRVAPIAQRRGVTMRLPALLLRSRKAFEAAEHARRHGAFDRLHRALFLALFERGQDIGEPGVLVTIGHTVGLDAGALRDALLRGTHAEAVLQDQRMALRRGIRDVPTMLVRAPDAPLHESFVIAGAQPFETVAAALAQVRGSAAGA